MSKTVIFDVTGAAVMCEMKELDVNGKHGYQMPGINKAYKKAIFADDMLMASKDGSSYVVALAVDVEGCVLSRQDVKEMVEDALAKRRY